MAEGQVDLLEPLQPAGSYGRTYRASNWEQLRDLEISELEHVTAMNTT